MGATPNFTVVVLSLLLVLMASSSNAKHSSSSNYPTKAVKGGYYPSDATNLRPDQINTHYFTHIFYAFLVPDNATFTFHITPDLSVSLRNFTTALRTKNPPAFPLFSIGGGGVSPELFSRMASTKPNRAAFINSTISVARAYAFAGFDLDYEFPQTAAEMEDFALLLGEWRRAVEDEATRTGQQRLLITAAVYYSVGPFLSGSPQVYPAVTIRENLDWVNVMNYDYHGSWDTTETGAHAQLYDPAGGNLSTSYGIESWIRAGLPPRMVVMGLPMYGRTWKLKYTNQTGIGAPATGLGPGDDGTMTYNQIVMFNEKNNATVVFDNTTVSMYSVAGKEWIGYDDEPSVGLKIGFAKKEKKLGGYFFWAVSGDHKWKLSKFASDSWDASSV